MEMPNPFLFLMLTLEFLNQFPATPDLCLY